MIGRTVTSNVDIGAPIGYRIFIVLSLESLESQVCCIAAESAQPLQGNAVVHIVTSSDAMDPFN
jgi:hypothetical protein